MDADIYTKPQLEIASPDVSCTHGATIGSFDEDTIFYLRSRGISEERSRGLAFTWLCARKFKKFR